MKCAIKSLLIGAAVFSSSALAERTQEMMTKCKPIAEAKVDSQGVWYSTTFDTGLCWGAFAAIQEFSRWANDPKRPDETSFLGFCAPEKSTRSQYVGIFVAYAQRNPALWHEDFVRVALAALTEAFPCRR